MEYSDDRVDQLRRAKLQVLIEISSEHDEEMTTTSSNWCVKLVLRGFDNIAW